MDLTPVIEAIGQDDQRWLGSAHGTSSGRSVTLDASLFTAATHFPNGYLPSGTALALKTSTGRYGPYTTGDANLGTLAGHLLTPTQVKTASSIPAGVLFEHGRVVQAFLPFTSGAGSVDTTGKGQVPLIKYV